MLRSNYNSSKASLKYQTSLNDSSLRSHDSALCLHYILLRSNFYDNKLLQLSQEFAVDVIEISYVLKEKKEHSFADQLKRSGTSISANIAEGNHPQSRADMISKFEIALKEANETENWLSIFVKSELISLETFTIVHKKLVKIKILLIESIKTLKNKR